MLAVFAYLLLLAACTREVVVEVVRAGDAITFTATRSGKPPCIKGLSVSLAGADIATTPPLWEVSTAEPGRCETRFTYGRVPQGYAQSGPAPRLLPSSRYLVEINGPGLQGGTEFTLRADDGAME
jgi:hypothetical protein